MHGPKAGHPAPRLEAEEGVMVAAAAQGAAGRAHLPSPCQAIDQDQSSLPERGRNDPLLSLVLKVFSESKWSNPAATHRSESPSCVFQELQFSECLPPSLIFLSQNVPGYGHMKIICENLYVSYMQDYMPPQFTQQHQ
jgi:hypothetical protein